MVAYLKSTLLGNPGNLIRRQHNAESQQHIAGEGQQAQKQKRCLHERRQADRRHLFHPLIEAVAVSSRYAEHIQSAYRHLHQQNAAALDVLKENLNNAVSKGNQGENVEQVHRDVVCHREAAHQHRGAFTGQVDRAPACEQAGQVLGKGVLQADAEFVQLYRHHADERTGKKSFENIDRRGLDVRSAALVLNRHIEDGDHRSGNEQRPAEQRKQLDCRLHPIEGEDVRAHIAHHGEEVRHSTVNGFVEPFQHGVPYQVGDLRAEEAECVADGAADCFPDLR